MKHFETFTRGGIVFLAVFKENGSCDIMSQCGANFGAWRDGIKSFEDFAKRNGGFDAVALGKAKAQIVPIR